ncbi:MAG: transglutaminase domain-containing protein [Chloroflexi bacterium]|nr:transglutaminase domain-containing protein [Chloroflexota bacterium]
MSKFKSSAFIVILAGLFFFSIAAAYAGSADDLREKARGFYDRGYYTAAYENYKKASELYSQKGDRESARSCNKMIHLVQRLCSDYQLDEKGLRESVKKEIPSLSGAELDELIKDGKIPFKIIDGKPYYFSEAAVNILFSDISLMRLNKKIDSAHLSFFDAYGDIIFRYSGSGYPEKKWKPIVKPVKYYGSYSLSIPKEKLPKTGVVRIWFPLPVLTECQRDVEVISVSPEQYFTVPAVISGDIGIAYCSIPISDVKDKLEAEVRFTFTHYEQRFDIDPENVGIYDKGSADYQRFTKSFGSTVFDEEISRKALDIVGGEKNPYRQARMIYDYIVRNINYGLMPHVSLGAEESPESLFVHKNGFGDCGAQSMYFAALCRSLGIPARATGGIQLCPGYSGPHFWAEFYLQNYGWVPADTSIAQTGLYPVGLTDEQRNKYIDYFFANQDPYRMVIQKDVDIPLNPPPEEPVLLPMAIQYPAVECLDSIDNISFTAAENCDMKIYPADR